MGKLIGKFIVSILVCQGAGFIGSLFTTPAIPTWYAALEKPIFTPPNWIFAPVWTLLFLLMGVALFVLWRALPTGRPVRWALAIFFVQLILNIFWSVFFFGMQRPFLAFLEIAVLWLAILASIVTSYRISRVAGSVLIPYLLWVSFAASLNFSLWRLNA